MGILFLSYCCLCPWLNSLTLAGCNIKVIRSIGNNKLHKVPPERRHIMDPQTFQNKCCINPLNKVWQNGLSSKKNTYEMWVAKKIYRNVSTDKVFFPCWRLTLTLGEESSWNQHQTKTPCHHSQTEKYNYKSTLGQRSPFLQEDKFGLKQEKEQGGRRRSTLVLTRSPEGRPGHSHSCTPLQKRHLSKG